MSAKKTSTRASGVQKRCALIVLGMHRSGTSALSGVLTKLGAQAPATQMPGDQNNPRGYWESDVLCRFHDNVLESAGTRWSDWDRFNEEWIDSPISDEFMDQLVLILKQEYGKSPLFLVKDPRMCRFLPIWLKVLDETGVVPKVVIPVRHPSEVSSSLVTRDHFTQTHARLLWLRHILDAEYSSRNVARVFVRYADLLRDWQPLAEKISTRLDIKWPRMSGSTKAEIDAYLAPELRHHVAPVVGEMGSSAQKGIVSWVETAFLAMERLVEDPGQEEALSTLDQIRRHFNETSEIYAPLVQEQCMGYEEKIGRAGNENSELLQALEALKQKHELLNMENIENYRKFMEAEERAAGLAGAVRERDAAFAEAVSGSSAMQAEANAKIGAAEARREEMVGRLRESEEAMETLKSEMVERLRESEEATGAFKSEMVGRLQDQELVFSTHREKFLSKTAELNAEIKRLQDAYRQTDEAAHERHLEIAKLTKLLLDAEQIAADRSLERDELVRKKEQLESAMEAARVLEQASSEDRARKHAQIEDALRAVRTLEREVEDQRRLVVDYRSSLDRIHASKYWRVLTSLRGLSKGNGEKSEQADEVSDEALVAQSTLFDAEWYLGRYPDVRAAGVDPLAHYLSHGANDGRDPGPAFSTSGYLSRYPDVSSLNLNPLAHYLRYGRGEGRSISPSDPGNDNGH